MANLNSYIIDGCQLQVDADRGVLYVHGPAGSTLLRICGLPTPIPELAVDISMQRLLAQPTMLDITTERIVGARNFYAASFSWGPPNRHKEEVSL